MIKPHYFNDVSEAQSDMALNMAKGQGYVPRGCLLGGIIVMGLVNRGDDPCRGCACPRDLCNGRPGDG
jgi:hypothetical protein